MRRATALAFGMLFLAILPLHATAQQPYQEPTSSSSASNVSQLSQEAKQAYDQKDYFTARKKFFEVAQLEPNNPRWHYNLGLTYRKLDNPHAARLSFIRVREIDANFKRVEIDDKLRSMGFDTNTNTTGQASTSNTVKPPSSIGSSNQPLIVDRSSSTDKRADPAQENRTTKKPEKGGIFSLLASSFCCFGLPLLIIVGIFFAVRRLIKKTGDQPPQAPSSGSSRNLDPQVLAAEESKLNDAAIQLVRVEHVMRLGENPDLRNLLEHATRNEQTAWKALAKVRKGDRTAFGQLHRTADETVTAAQRATDLATQLYGDQAFTGQGERVGCFFCARPLANGDYRRHITMKHGETQDEIMACPDCAGQTERGESPTIRTGTDGRTHWSEIPNYDPYAMRHGEPNQTGQVEAWRYEPQQPMSNLSQLASGGALLGAGALAGAGVVMAASRFFDLNSARHTGLEQDALSESAFQASGRRGKYHSHDHS